MTAIKVYWSLKWNEIKYRYDMKMNNRHGVEKYITVQCDIQCLTLIYITYIYIPIIVWKLYSYLSFSNIWKFNSKSPIPIFDFLKKYWNFNFNFKSRSYKDYKDYKDYKNYKNSRPQKFTITGTLDTVPHVLEIIMMKVSRYGLFLWWLWWWFLLFEFLFCVEIRALVLHFLCFLCERVWIIINSLE